MSWQEELRRLDEELAAGRISADDYRVRRDQVLSSAVSQGDTTGQQQAPADSTVDSNQQQTSTADSTQVVTPVDAPESGADSTQIVSAAPQSWHGNQPWGQQAHSPAAGVQQPPQHQHAQQQAGGFQQPPQQQSQAPWNAPEADATPPWGGSDFPPMQATEPGARANQGPEGFNDEKAGGNKGKIVATVAAVILLGGVAFGAYWLWGRGDGAMSPAASTAAQAPAGQNSPTQPPKDDLPVAKLPGAPEKHPEVKSFSDVSALNYLNDDELRVYEGTEPKKTKFRVQHFDNGNLGVFLLVETNGVDRPEEVEQKLADIQVTNGAEPKTEAPAGVAATRFTKQDGSLSQVRAHYFSGDILVRVELISKESLESASTQFDSVIKKQLQELPADG